MVDAVSPVPQARQGWRELAADANERLVVVEVEVGDVAEHRRRVEDRRSGIDGLTVPTWRQVGERDYRLWDEHRDGPRLRLLNDDAPRGLAAVLAHIERATG